MDITLTEIIAALGGIVIAARVIVKLTPTPKDDTILEKVVKFLKHIGLHISLFVALVALSGCARFGTVQTDASYEEGKLVRKITTRAAATTVFESKSTLAKWKATQTDKNQGAEVGGLSQEAGGTNTVAALNALLQILNAVK